MGKSIFTTLVNLVLRKEPRTLILEVTDMCNLSCRYCYRPQELNKKNNHLTISTLAQIKKNLCKSSDSFSIGISGGEPLLNPDINQIVESLLEIDSNANLLTNLSLLTHEKALRLKKAGLKEIQITVFSPIPEEHDYLRNCSDFSRTMQAIACLKELDFKIEAILLVTSANCRSTISAMEMLLSLGINGFMINRYNASFPEKTGLSDDLFLDKKLFLDWLNELENFARHHGFTIPFAIPVPPCTLPDGCFFPHLEFTFCPIGRRGEYLTISPAGDVRPCNHLPIILGNLCHETLDEILQGDCYKTCLQKIDTPPEFCRNCAAWSSCRGGCRGAAWSWSGSIGEHDPWLNRVKTRRLDGSEQFRPEYDKNDQWKK